MLLDAARREVLSDTRPESREAGSAASPRAPAEPGQRGGAVTIRDLHKSFDGHAVIEGLNLFLPADVHKRDLHQIHWMAWRRGVKTLYYIRLRQMALEGTEIEGCVSCML